MIVKLILVIFFLFGVSSVLNFYFKQKIKLMNSVLSFKRKTNFFDGKNIDYNLIYVPHHQTNWSLNPYYKNKFSKHLSHTDEGFRKVDDKNSLIETIKELKNKKKIICIGGSTTHCVEMDNYEDTWPSVLNRILGKKNFQVFNFGVGGWGTAQSINRLIYWSTLIKPDLIIFYQAKNDLTPFANINQIEKIYPDFQNNINQFSQSFRFNIPKFFFLIPFFKLFYYYIVFKPLFEHNGLLDIYNPKAELNTEGLNRIEEHNLDSIFLRIETIFNFTNFYNCKLLYIPEILQDGAYKNFLKEKIYPVVKNNLSKKYKNVRYVEYFEEIERDTSNFVDKMHFSKKGNNFFANILLNKVLEILK